MSAYNAADHLAEALDSILAQSFRDFHIYVVDDGSTDSTAKILHAYIRDPRLRLLQNHGNKGLVHSLNKLVRIARQYEFIARMDADDIALPRRFAAQVAYLDANPSVGVLGGASIHFGRRTVRRLVRNPRAGVSARSLLLLQNSISHPTVMIRSRYLPERDDVYADLSKLEDYALWIEMSSRCELGNLPEALLLYRRHGSNITNTYLADVDESLRLRRTLLDDFCQRNEVPLPNWLRELIIDLYVRSGDFSGTGEAVRAARETLVHLLAARPDFDLKVLLSYFDAMVLRSAMKARQLSRCHWLKAAQLVDGGRTLWGGRVE